MYVLLSEWDSTNIYYKIGTKMNFKKLGTWLFHKWGVPQLYLQEKAYPYSFYMVQFISEALLIVTEPGVIPSPSQTDRARSFLKLISAWRLWFNHLTFSPFEFLLVLDFLRYCTVVTVSWPTLSYLNVFPPI